MSVCLLIGLLKTLRADLQQNFTRDTSWGWEQLMRLSVIGLFVKRITQNIMSRFASKFYQRCVLGIGMVDKIIRRVSGLVQTHFS